MPDSSKPGTAKLNVLKRDGSVQPFDKNKLSTSMTKAGATTQQAALVINHVISRLGDKQKVKSSQLSSMVARSLSQVNPVASSQYTAHRDQRLRSSLAITAEGAAFRRGTLPRAMTAEQPTTSAFPSAVPEPAQLGVVPVLKVSASPPTASVALGEYATFTATASGGTPPYTYQWTDGKCKLGTEAAMAITSTPAGTHSFYCKVTDAGAPAQTANSNTVTLVVTKGT